MARTMDEWHPKHRPITKIMLPDGVKGDTAPLALGLWYDFPEFGGYLGNVGIISRSTWEGDQSPSESSQVTNTSFT